MLWAARRATSSAFQALAASKPNLRMFTSPVYQKSILNITQALWARPKQVYSPCPHGVLNEATSELQLWTFGRVYTIVNHIQQLTMYAECSTDILGASILLQYEEGAAQLGWFLRCESGDCHVPVLLQHMSWTTDY